MTELSVEGATLDRLAQHFVDRGANHFEPCLILLGSSYPNPRYRSFGGIDVTKWDDLGKDYSFFAAIAPRDGTYAIANEKDFGGNLPTPSGSIEVRSPAPWAAKFAADWNTAVAGRATDMTRVIDELYKLADILIAIVEDYENQDLYNADGIRRSYQQGED